MHFREVYLACRKSAIEKFDKSIPTGKALMEEMEDYLERLYSRLSEISLTGEKEHHRLPLIISFVQTHFVIDELLRCCENIEAATLVRKQLEVLARYKETENLPKFKKAIEEKKVPQMKNVENAGVMYGMLSEIAHSAKPETYTLLGYEKQEKTKSAASGSRASLCFASLNTVTNNIIDKKRPIMPNSTSIWMNSLYG